MRALGGAMSDRKEGERRAVDRLLAVVEPALLGQVVASESPDFVVPARRPSLGIEVRKLLWGADAIGRPLQASEGVEDKVKEKAVRLWQERGLPPVHASVHWHPHQPPAARKADAIAVALVDAVAARLPAITVGGSPVSLTQSGLPGDALPPEVGSVLVVRFAGLTRTFWSASRAGGVGQCEPDALEVAFREKDALLPEYRQQAEELWLALSITEAAPSSFVDVPASTLVRRYASGFDRAFIVEHGKDRVHELLLERSGA